MTQINSLLKISFFSSNCDDIKIFVKHTSHNQCVPASFSKDNYSDCFLLWLPQLVNWIKTLFSFIAMLGNFHTKKEREEQKDLEMRHRYLTWKTRKGKNHVESTNSKHITIRGGVQQEDSRQRPWTLLRRLTATELHTLTQPLSI